MPYLFALLVAANAVFMGYQLIKSRDPAAVAPISFQSNEQYPQTLPVIPAARTQQAANPS